MNKPKYNPKINSTMKQKGREWFMSLRKRVPMQLIHAIGPVMVACGLATQAQATDIPVPNGSFETPIPTGFNDGHC